VDYRTSDVSIFMCSGDAHWILVMFDVIARLLCWILICWIVMCMLYFLLLCICCIFYMLGFGGSPAREADKICKKKLKNLIFVGYVHQLTDVHNLCSSVGRGT
jgi:hypothetical protein